MEISWEDVSEYLWQVFKKEFRNLSGICVDVCLNVCVKVDLQVT